MKYTDEQQKVIDVRDCNLLVSAAAGSGKTAVLVQRILDKVMQGTDIDRMLIMTFTKAAAAEMKERLLRRLNEAMVTAQQNGDLVMSRRLMRQTGLIRGAYISTIDGFCTNVLRNHFGQVDLDPAFRIADDSELKLIKADVMSELLEAEYEEGRPEFLRFVDSYVTKRTDFEIEDAIYKLYDYSQSKPYPVKWIEGCVKNYSAEGDIFESELIKEYLKQIDDILSGICDMARRALDLSLSEAGPYMYVPVIEDEFNQFMEIHKCWQANRDFDKLRKNLSSIQFASLKAVRDKSVDPDVKAAAKGLRDIYKPETGKLLEKFLYASKQQIIKDVEAAAPVARELTGLVIKFSNRFEQAKKEKSVVDFSDLEHLTIRAMTAYDDKGEPILDEKGQPLPSAIALEYRDLFEEIYIDEYQDSNAVQEAILQLIARRDSGRRNLFMVGDVKQSIYRFRLADPTLFIHKSENYDLEEYDEKGQKSDDLRIDLHKNFRSRRQVIDTVNFFFDKLMKKEVGNVEYDQDARLVYGASYIENEEANLSEMLLIKPDEEYTDAQMEAMAVATRIQELMKGYMVQDGEVLRPVRYKDIAILMRTSKWDDTFDRIFAQYGIPCFTESKTGYFDGYEIRTIINMLTVINNPRDDVELCAALKGYFGGLNDEELAQIRIENKKISFYEAARAFAAKEDDLHNTIKSKLTDFFLILEKYEKLAVTMPVHDLIDTLITESCFKIAVASMTNGDRAEKNLDILVTRARDYEKTSYRGLFNFIRYVNQMKKYELDYGQAQGVSDEADAVRILTIHKSKGLEFPVCFVSGMGRGFNKMDQRSRMVMDSDYGIGIDLIDFENRVKAPTIIKKAIISKMDRDSLGEELRVLYVALTRAKEKLIVTGIVSDSMADTMNSKIIPAILEKEEKELSDSDILSAGSYMDWLLKGLVMDQNGVCFFEEISQELSLSELERSVEMIFETLKTAPVAVKYVDLRHIVAAEVTQQLEDNDNRLKIQRIIAGEERPEKTEDYKSVFNWKYPYDQEVTVPAKASVSYLKHLALEENEGLKLFEAAKDGNEGDVAEDEKPSKAADASPVPDFIKKLKGQETIDGAENLIGSLRGTAYHRMFELLDYSGDLSMKGIEKQIEYFVENGFMEKSWGDALWAGKFSAFAKTDIGKRMQAASKRGSLRREQPFCILVPANTVDAKYPASEQILIQGIIDAMFYEDDECVIVDYKTDNVKEIGELERRYKIQLDYYARAISQITGKRVKEKIIYSVKFNEELRV